MTALTRETVEAMLAGATPGPWRAEAMGGSSTVLTPTMPPKNDTRSMVAYGYRDEAGYCIAHPFLYQVAPSDQREETRMDFVCFGHADARLIAAAPDLAAALLAAWDREAKLREAATKALNYITNCESDFGITLTSGDALRAALAGGTP